MKEAMTNCNWTVDTPISILHNILAYWQIIIKLNHHFALHDSSDIFLYGIAPLIWSFF